MSNPVLGALVLAAGKGTRMPSPRPKVLQTLLGEPMLALVQRAVASLVENNIWILAGHGIEMVRAAFAQANILEQNPQRGTGHALITAFPHLREAGLDKVLVVNGDVPLILPETLATFVQNAGNAAMAFLTLEVEDAAAYGRVRRNNQGCISAIVEAKDDASPLPCHEINAGIYLFSMDFLEALLPKLGCNNAAGEYYLTDLVGMGVKAGYDVRGIICHEEGQLLLGANTPRELAHAEAILQARQTGRLMAQGVIIHLPESVRISPMAVVEPGAELFGPCEIYGTSHVGFGAIIHSHCVLRHAHVHENATVHSFSHIEMARVDKNCIVGPYARLRPGAVLEENVHVGNFVEVKNSTLHQGTKANHLTYLGDADIGPDCNIGAGTITCNYDGKRKHRTSIGAHAFIGSNTALVAPVSVGENALVAAGSVITHNVPEGTLAVARARQTNMKRRRG